LAPARNALQCWEADVISQRGAGRSGNPRFQQQPDVGNSRKFMYHQNGYVIRYTANVEVLSQRVKLVLSQLSAVDLRATVNAFTGCRNEVYGGPGGAWASIG